MFLWIEWNNAWPQGYLWQYLQSVGRRNTGRWVTNRVLSKQISFFFENQQIAD